MEETEIVLILRQTKKKAKEQANIDIVEHALKIVGSDKNMYKVLFEKEDLMSGLMEYISGFQFDIVRSPQIN